LLVFTPILFEMSYHYNGNDCSVICETCGGFGHTYDVCTSYFPQTPMYSSYGAGNEASMMEDYPREPHIEYPQYYHPQENSSPQATYYTLSFDSHLHFDQQQQYMPPPPISPPPEQNGLEQLLKDFESRLSSQITAQIDAHYDKTESKLRVLKSEFSNLQTYQRNVEERWNAVKRTREGMRGTIEKDDEFVLEQILPFDSCSFQIERNEGFVEVNSACTPDFEETLINSPLFVENETVMAYSEDIVRVEGVETLEKPWEVERIDIVDRPSSLEDLNFDNLLICEFESVNFEVIDRVNEGDNEESDKLQMSMDCEYEKMMFEDVESNMINGLSFEGKDIEGIQLLEERVRYPWLECYDPDMIDFFEEDVNYPWLSRHEPPMIEDALGMVEGSPNRGNIEMSMEKFNLNTLCEDSPFVFTYPLSIEPSLVPLPTTSETLSEPIWDDYPEELTVTLPLACNDDLVKSMPKLSLYDVRVGEFKELESGKPWVVEGRPSEETEFEDFSGEIDEGIDVYTIPEEVEEDKTTRPLEDEFGECPNLSESKTKSGKRKKKRVEWKRRKKKVKFRSWRVRPHGGGNGDVVRVRRSPLGDPG